MSQECCYQHAFCLDFQKHSKTHCEHLIKSSLFVWLQQCNFHVHTCSRGWEVELAIFLLINALIQNSLGALGHITHCWKGIFEENTMPLRLWEMFGSYGECHGTTSFPPLCLPLPTSIYVHPPPLMSACPPWLLWSILAVYSHNYIVPTVRLTSDQGQTCPDLVPMPRAATHMSFSPFVLFAWSPFIGNNG